MELLTSIVIVDVVNKEYLWQDAASFPTEGWSKSLQNADKFRDREEAIASITNGDTYLRDLVRYAVIEFKEIHEVR